MEQCKHTKLLADFFQQTICSTSSYCTVYVHNSLSIKWFHVPNWTATVKSLNMYITYLFAVASKVVRQWCLITDMCPVGTNFTLVHSKGSCIIHSFQYPFTLGRSRTLDGTLVHHRTLRCTVFFTQNTF